MRLENKNILLGVTGDISAYKSPAICSLLKKNGANIKVVMTEAATKFISPLIFKTLSDNFVYTDTLTKTTMESEIEHTELAKWADIIVIAPATANTIAKLANGIGDNLLSKIFLVHGCPVLIVPAMNNSMLKSLTNIKNIQKLRDRGINVPRRYTDFSTCENPDYEIMLKSDELVEEIDFTLREKDLTGKKFIVTAGPTQEAIDPVRYITNHSSGKMGYALAEEASKRGAIVTLISGPTNLKIPKVKNFIQIISADDMYNAVKSYFNDTDVLIKAGAPEDFKPETYIDEKIKKEGADEGMVLTMTHTPDIAKAMGKIKEKQIIAGFAAESQNEIENGLKKLKAKNFDMIIINNIMRKDAGFKADTNKVIIIDKNENIEDLELMSKLDLAGEILDRIKNLF